MPPHLLFLLLLLLVLLLLLLLLFLNMKKKTQFKLCNLLSFIILSAANVFAKTKMAIFVDVLLTLSSSLSEEEEELSSEELESQKVHQSVSNRNTRFSVKYIFRLFLATFFFFFFVCFFFFFFFFSSSLSEEEEEDELESCKRVEQLQV